MKYMLLQIVFLFCIFTIFHLNGAKQMNVAVTLHRKDIPLFSEQEIWGIQYVNKTAEIVQLNVVIDEFKSMEIRKLKNDAIMGFDIIYPDIEEPLRRERERINNTKKWTPSDLPDLFFDEYRNWPEYELFIAAFVVRHDIASRSIIGQTIEGNNIEAVTLSTGGGTNKPGLYIQAVVHAREWLANAATMYIMNVLGERYGLDPDITMVLNAINIYIVPTVNIDGYEYTWLTERMWRKNRKNNGDGSFGVDINRNYDGPIGTWCTSGASSTPSSNTYCGTEPFSEPETQAVAQFIRNSVYNIRAAIDMHTSGPLILWPWGYSVDPLPPPYFGEYERLGKEMEDAAFDVHGVTYESMQSAFLYPASGAMEDFVWAEDGILGFTFEGRGPGFAPPPDNIIPAGEEQLAAILALARHIMP